MRPPPPPRRFSKTSPSDQCLDPNLVALRGLALPGSGAGDGNRTHTGGASGAKKQEVWRDSKCQGCLACEFSRYVGPRRATCGYIGGRSPVLEPAVGL